MNARRDSGFTLIETLITTVVLVTGLAAVACLFSYSARTNIENRQRTTATVLLYDKLEELKTSVLDGTNWTAGTHSDRVTIDNVDYVRTWQISAGIPRQATVVIVIEKGSPKRVRELARASMMAGPVF
jgi:prepilin-type N-terminal cleavage/methylation domain-containing protein